MGILGKINSLLLGCRRASAPFVEYLRKQGITIGEDVTFHDPASTVVDVQNPQLITIGDHVNITRGVVILTHDYSWAVLKAKPDEEAHPAGGIFGACGHVTIGNNVFIGVNAIITRGVTIGDDVIIGAGSVVTKDCLAGGIYAGNPARRVMDLETYYEKRRTAQLKEAKEQALAYHARFGKRPEPEVFHEFFMLFADENAVRANPVFANKMKLCQNPEASYGYLRNNPPMFDSYEAFMTYCFEE